MKMSFITKFLKTAHEIAKIRIKEREQHLIHKNKPFCSSKSFLFFGGPRIKFFINRFLIKNIENTQIISLVVSYN